MIKAEIVKHEYTFAVDEFGDILKPFKDWRSTSTGAGWFSKPPEEVWKDKTFLDLWYVLADPWRALDRLGIGGVVHFKSSVAYTCPYSTNVYYTFVPQYVFTDDVEALIKDNPAATFSGFVRDQAYQRQLFNDRRCNPHNEAAGPEHRFPFGALTESFLGHGYTDGTLPHDGHGKLMPATVALSNGDYIGGTVWVWFNK